MSSPCLALVSPTASSAGDAQHVVFAEFEVRNIQIGHPQQLRVLVGVLLDRARPA